MLLGRHGDVFSMSEWHSWKGPNSLLKLPRFQQLGRLDVVESFHSKSVQVTGCGQCRKHRLGS